MKLISKIIIPTLSLVASGVSAVAEYALTNSSMNTNETDVNYDEPRTGGGLMPEPVAGGSPSILAIIVAGTVTVIVGTVVYICHRHKKTASANEQNQTEEANGTEPAAEHPFKFLLSQENTNVEMTTVTGEHSVHMDELPA